MKSLIIAAYFTAVGYYAHKSHAPQKIGCIALNAWDELNRRSAAQFLNEVERRGLPVTAKVQDAAKSN
jgi:hypothetical protein